MTSQSVIDLVFGSPSETPDPVCRDLWGFTHLEQWPSPIAKWDRGMAVTRVTIGESAYGYRRNGLRVSFAKST
jgi:hypothetical protein